MFKFTIDIRAKEVFIGVILIIMAVVQTTLVTFLTIHYINGFYINDGVQGPEEELASNFVHKLRLALQIVTTIVLLGAAVAIPIMLIGSFLAIYVSLNPQMF